MGFGGGGSPGTDLAEIVEDSLSLLLIGHSDAGSGTWQNSISAGGPSILGWIRDKGLTERQGNPYVIQEPYDPATEITRMRTASDQLLAEVHSIDADGEVTTFLEKSFQNASRDLRTLDIEDIFNEVVSQSRTDAGVIFRDAMSRVSLEEWDQITDSAMDSFRRRNDKVHQRTMAQFAARHSTVGSVRSSAFAIGMAVLESDREDRALEYETNLNIALSQLSVQSFFSVITTTLQSFLQARLTADINSEKDRLTYGLQTYATMAQMRLQAVDSLAGSQTLVADVSRATIVAEAERYDRTIDHAVKETLWDVDIMQRAANVVSAATGAAVPTQGPGKFQTALGTTLVSAGTGASIGANFGPQGAAIGAGIGAVVGIGASLLG